MGNQCTSGDNDSYANTTKAITINEEFIEGYRPVICQDHSKFNDDDAIDVVITSDTNYGRKSLSQNYMKQACYVLQDNVQLKLYYCGLPIQGSQAILLSIQTKDQAITTRQGIDLICLIDHSGSMSGEKMNLVKKSLKNLLNMLQPHDRLCLIEFDDQNYRLTRLMRVTQENMYKFLIAIDTIEANGSTDIGNAMKMALSILKHRRFKNPIASIYLLSDGEDEGAAGRVWNDIQLKNIKEPFSINTFGFGRDCCPKIMSEIAHFKEGQFYYISDVQKIDECFFEALGGQASVIAYNTSIIITLKIQLNLYDYIHLGQKNNNNLNQQKQIMERYYKLKLIKLNYNTISCNKNTIKKVYGDKWALNQQNQSFSIYQPQLQFGVRKDFIIETVVPFGMMDEIITVKMHTDSVETGERFTIEQFINIIPNLVAEQIVLQEVMSHYYRVQAAESFRNALNFCYNLQYQQAQQIIIAVQQQIYQMNLNNPMINLVYLDLQSALRYCDSMIFNQEGRHYLTQFYMIHMYQQPRGIEIVQNNPKTQVTCVYQNELQRQYQLQLRQIKIQQS